MDEPLAYRVVDIAPSSMEADLLPCPPDGWTDALTGTDGPRLWDRIVTSELARVRRYRRPATVALVEVVGLDDFARLWGADVAEPLFVDLARTLAVEVRSSDHIARVDRVRFGILLTETDEIAAINFVERARVSCERRAARAAGLVRVAMGWASPNATNDLHKALQIAEQRLAAEITG